MSQDPTDILSKLVEHGRGIKFGRGIVGKTSHATFAVMGLWAAIVLKLGTNLWLDLGLGIAGVIGTGIYIWFVRGTRRFARENPGLAMLEGAEFIEYQKWEAEVKGIRGPIRGEAIPDPSRTSEGDGG